MALFAYQQELQTLLTDDINKRFNLFDLTKFINRARRKIATATQCIRILPPSSGSFLTLTPSAGGSGYTAPTVSINAPDAIGNGFVQATATATVGGGVITGFTITNPGTGYVAAPTITITDATGSGAVAASTFTPFVSANAGQEVYNFSTVDAIIQANFPGVNNITAVQSVAVSWGSWKPMMRNIAAWSQFQAYCRAWDIGQQNYPTIWSQYGQGENGSIYLFPIPSILAQMDWDCYCTPIDLALDSDVEAIPHPFTEAIPFYAAYWAYMSAQNQDMAAIMWQNYKNNMAEARAFVSPAVTPDYYPGEF